MANPYLPREQVHAWSNQIGEQAEEHQASLNRLLKDQRRIARFIMENSESMGPVTGNVASYLCGVVMRMFDLAGGRLRNATWAQVRDAESRIQGVIGELLPLDDGFMQRARAVSWRAQPHILDEALMSLFERAKGENEEEVDKTEALKIYLLMWVATEVLDSNWRPSKSFSGETEYTYVHIEPEPLKA